MPVVTRQTSALAYQDIGSQVKSAQKCSVWHVILKPLKSTAQALNMSDVTLPRSRADVKTDTWKWMENAYQKIMP
ncbi:hypothetical protein DPMN_133245 [Dreissena polymorpha]|uniref:Uncharacterized protein n=1 Tax=Dreissena polymorpha TaxID=45954 RepID=A0A9D4FTY9_DREPO|nr:hypothetical protein DPMN_133245 [Dreissena polymorpha]